MHDRISYTYHWRDLGDGGQEEPNDTLANGGRISLIGNTTTSKKGKHPHLSPHETSHTIYARFVGAQAEQANEHNEK
jgi:hypothetical protein